jgi:hypothetical protein
MTTKPPRPPKYIRQSALRKMSKIDLVKIIYRLIDRADEREVYCNYCGGTWIEGRRICCHHGCVRPILFDSTQHEAEEE